MLSFSDGQKDRLQAAAALLPEGARNTFVKLVSNHIISRPPTMAAVEAGIVFALGVCGVACGPDQTKKERRHAPSNPRRRL
jgi:hypothetical protein